MNRNAIKLLLKNIGRCLKKNNLAVIMKDGFIKFQEPF